MEQSVVLVAQKGLLEVKCSYCHRNDSIYGSCSNGLKNLFEEMF